MPDNLTIQARPDGAIELLSEERRLLETFIVKENLSRALELLKQINSIKTKHGKPIYETRMYAGKSTWAFHQHVLFGNYLRQYASYESIIKYLHDHNFGEVAVTGNLGELEGLLKINGVRVAKSQEKERSRRSGSAFKAWAAKAFAGLLTGAAFLKLFFGRSRLLVYTPDKYSRFDCDFRFAAVYDYLRKNRISFVEVFHTLLGKEFYENFLKRKRAAFYLEALTFSLLLDDNFKAGDIDLSCVENHNRRYFVHLLSAIDKRAQVSGRLIKTLSFLLKLTAVKKIIAVDDMRFTSELIMAGRLNNIEIFGFQHGAFIKYLVGYMNYGIPRNVGLPFDKLFVWNEYWKRVLLDFSCKYDETNVVVGGCLRELPVIPYEKKASKITDIAQVNMLVPYEGMIGPTNTMREINFFIEKFLGLGMKIFFKVRQDTEISQQLRLYGLSDNDKVVIVKEMDGEVLSKIDAVAGSYSTFLNEMLFYDKPVFLMKTSFDMGHRLLDDNLAVLLPEDFQPEIIIDGINNFVSRRQLAWPASLPLEETLGKILSSK